MSFSFGVTLNSDSRQISERLPFITYADRDSTLNFPGHDGATASASSALLAPSPSDIGALVAVPPRRPSSRRRELGYIPRPRNAFIFFRSWYINSMRSSKAVKQNELSKQAGETWKRMSIEEKKPFLQYAAIEKEQHYAMFPDYVYSPNTTSVKSSTKRKASNASEYRAASATPLSASPMSWDHIGEEFRSFGREPPSPFHPHMDHVSNQFSYQQYTHDTLPTSLPTLPCTCTWVNQDFSIVLPDMTTALSLNSSSYPLHHTPPPVTHDNSYPSADYLGLMDYTFSEESLETDVLMQQFMDDSLEWLALISPLSGFSANYEHQ